MTTVDRYRVVASVKALAHLTCIYLRLSREDPSSHFLRNVFTTYRTATWIAAGPLRK